MNDTTGKMTYINVDETNETLHLLWSTPVVMAKPFDDDFLNNTKKIYIKQNLIGLWRLYYEQQKNSYGISEDTDKICMDYNKIFAYNIYLLLSYL